MAIRSGWLVVCLSTVSLSSTILLAQTDEQIESARTKALEFIRSKQEDGHWAYTGHDTGITALCTLALLENGAAIYDPVVERGYRYVRRTADDRKETYDLALSILLLARVGDRLDRPLIRNMGAKLLAGQTKTGGWSYTCPDVESTILQNVSRIERKPGVGDNSNTQFAVLGLWVASRTGLPIEEAMRDVGARFVESQQDDGGWIYAFPEKGKAKPSTPSTEAMTPAGLFCLTVARASKIRSQLKETKSSSSVRGEKETLLSDPLFAKGLSRVAYFAKNTGPGKARYSIWAVERVAVMLGIEKFEGDVDWFKLGADSLIKTQKPDGSWPSDNAGNILADTCLAALFLRKANLGSDISRLLTGQPEQVFSIANKPGPPRFDTLQDALKASEAGDVIRVDGNGPYKMIHDDLNKDITIQAGFGYDPVFEFQIGSSADGIRFRPDKDTQSHQMLVVSGGTVTLEGLRMQMDAPSTANPIPWKGILVTGGTLRMLNCSLSEGNRRGITGVAIKGPGTAVFRNCVFIGGKSCVDIEAKGKQDITFDNSILYSNNCMTVSTDPQSKQPADIDLHIYQSVVQGVEAFSFPNVAGDIRIESVQNAYKCDALGLSMLASATDKKGREWKGLGNCYNVTNWIGAGGKKNTTVVDLKSFSKFWGDTDKEHSKLTIAFMTVKKAGAAASYNHTSKPDEWDIQEKSELATVLKRPGIRPQTVGPGEGFSRYREEFRYGDWKKGINTSSVVTDLADSSK